MWDWLGSLFGGGSSGFDWGSLLKGLSALGVGGASIYGAMNQPKQQQVQQPTYNAPQVNFPDMSEWEPFKFEFSMPEQPTIPKLDPNMLRQSARSSMGDLQQRGVYNGGATSKESLAAMAGITDPDQLKQFLEANQGLLGGF